MAATTRSGETRWQRAVRQARSLAASAAGDVALATTADGLVEGPTADTALIETAIDRLRPSGGDSAAWPRVPGTDRVYFITDGAVARALDPDVVVQSVFEAAANDANRRVRRAAVTGRRWHRRGLRAGPPTMRRPRAPVRLIVSRGQTVLSRSARRHGCRRSRQCRRSRWPRRAAPGSCPHRNRRTTALAEDNEAVAWIEGVDAVNVSVVSETSVGAGGLLQQDPSLHVVFVKPAEYKPRPAAS
jgi:hypothetical protein